MVQQSKSRRSISSNSLVTELSIQSSIIVYLPLAENTELDRTSWLDGDLEASG